MPHDEKKPSKKRCISLALHKMKQWANSQKKGLTTCLLKFAIRMYHALPLTFAMRAKLTSLVLKIAPSLLSRSRLESPGTSKPHLRGTSTVTPDSHPIHTGVSIATSDEPLISIIIPVYGKLEYTLQCLASIARHPPCTRFEVIVVDDHSPDDSADILQRTVHGIQLLRNDCNQGFIRSCNAGADTAQGQYLYFLNNDTELTPSSIDALLRTFSDFPNTGLAGSKLIYPDGRLQEAGCIIWQDADAWNVGRCSDAQLPIFNYAREVDYCSAASIMVPKHLFEELGGFDEHFSPAYCEDCDIALKIREKGYRVIYQPQSTVIHYEGITSGTDTSEGAKSYQIVNCKKLFLRWQKQLARHHKHGSDIDNAKDRHADFRVLFLDLCTPTPDRDSGSIDAYNHMLLLREMGFQVTFIPTDNYQFLPGYTDDLQRQGIEALYAPYVTSVAQHLEKYGSRYHLIFISRMDVYDYNIKIIRKYAKNAKVLFHTVDLHFLRMQREAELHHLNKKFVKNIKTKELRCIKSADIATVISEAEQLQLAREIPDSNVRLLPYSRTIAGTKTTFSDRKHIVFVGQFLHKPNCDAVLYFVHRIMPLLREQLPGVQFYVVGSNPPDEILALASSDVIITGYVARLNPLLDKMRVSVAPLRYGAGIKGKVGSALSAGLPVVATTTAVEGMSLIDGKDVLVADDPEAFAQRICRIYRDETLWQKLSTNGIDLAEKKWGAASAWNILANIMKELGFPISQRQHPVSLYSEKSHQEA